MGRQANALGAQRFAGRAVRDRAAAGKVAGEQTGLLAGKFGRVSAAEKGMISQPPRRFDRYDGFPG